MKKTLRALLAKVIMSSKLVACTSSKPSVDAGATDADSSTNTTAEGDTSTTEEPTTEEPTTEEPTTTQPPYEPITLAFAGDMYLSDKLYGYYQKDGLTGFLGQSILDIFQKTDIMVANHEYVATDLPESAKDTIQIYNFKAPTAREVLWDEMGVDIVSLANNHAMDYGLQSLVDCLDTIDKLNVKYIGAGRNLADAKKAEIYEMNGKKVAILASCYFIPGWSWYAQENRPGVMTTYEGTDRYGMVKDEIKRLKEEEGCDVVGVYVHYGKEHTTQIISRQKNVSYGYIDSGADFIIGSHAHNLQGIEIYKDAPIYYNLGNFLFTNKATDTMVVNLVINEDNSITTKITPCKSKSFKVWEATGQEALDIFKHIESISVNVEIDDEGNVTEKKAAENVE